MSSHDVVKLSELQAGGLDALTFTIPGFGSAKITAREQF
jgi:hypothetical protein